MKKKSKRKMLITISLLSASILAVYIFLQHPKFGKLPSAERLTRIQQSPHFKDGKFNNLSPTSVMTEGVSYISVLKDFIFSKDKNPPSEIPSIKTDLLNLNNNEDVLVWFGHSSYFIQLDGKRILVDPVLSGSASPVSFTTKAFKGTDRYSTDDIPEIDYLFITHDHWDHLDYETVIKLKSKIKKIITGLGTGAHFEYWGFDKSQIIESDWNESMQLDTNFMVHALPARHFSGRGLTANKSLWSSFLLQTAEYKLYIGGDSGYDTHFAKIGADFGSIDLAILENGQNDLSWKYIHMLTDEVIQAAKDLKARRLFPVHSSKFALANHSWDAPLKKITEANKATQFPIVTPMIGEKLILRDTTQVFSKWWESVQ